MEKVESLEREYGRVSKALEYVMPLVDGMNGDELKRKIFEKRKGQIIIGNHYLDNPRSVIAET